MVDSQQADQDELLAAEATQEGSECQHHWVLAAPDGPVSKGACRSCGEERDFQNHIEHDWGQMGRRRASAGPTGGRGTL